MYLTHLMLQYLAIMDIKHQKELIAGVLEHECSEKFKKIHGGHSHTLLSRTNSGLRLSIVQKCLRREKI